MDGRNTNFLIRDEILYIKYLIVREARFFIDFFRD